MSTIPGQGLSLGDTIKTLMLAEMSPAQGIRRAEFMASRKTPGTRLHTAWLYLAARLKEGILPKEAECFEAANAKWRAAQPPKAARPVAAKATTIEISDADAAKIADIILAKLNLKV